MKSKMHDRLLVRLGALGFLAGALVAPIGPALCLLPLFTAASGLALAEWLHRHVGEVSLPKAAFLGTPVCALVSGIAYGLCLDAAWDRG